MWLVRTFINRTYGSQNLKSGASYDVFGDGMIQLVHTPGYARGMFSVSVRGTSGYLVLGSDAACLILFRDTSFPASPSTTDWQNQSLPDMSAFLAVVKFFAFDFLGRGGEGPNGALLIVQLLSHMAIGIKTDKRAC